MTVWSTELPDLSDPIDSHEPQADMDPPRVLEVRGHYPGISSKPFFPIFETVNPQTTLPLDPNPTPKPDPKT